MKYSIKNFLLESISEANDDFLFVDKNSIQKISDVNFNKIKNYLKIDFITTYNKKYSFLIKLSDFNKWFSDKKNKKGKNIFHDYLQDYFHNSVEVKEKINEIIDDTNEIIPDEDMPSNVTNSMVGTNHSMDLEKILKRSAPKSIKNYSGNLGLGTVAW